MVNKSVQKKPGSLSIASFIAGPIPGIFSIVKLISLFILYLGYRFKMYPYGTDEIWGFKNLMVSAVWWIYLIVWIALIFVPIPALIAIICGSIDLSRNKESSLNSIGRRLDIAGILLALSSIAVIGMIFIPAVSRLISKIPG